MKLIANYLNRSNGRIISYIPETLQQANHYVWLLLFMPKNVNWFIYSSNLSNSPFKIGSSHFQLKVSFFHSLLLLLLMLMLLLLLLTLLPLPSSQRQQNFNSFWFVAPLFTRSTSKDWLTDWLCKLSFMQRLLRFCSPSFFSPAKEKNLLLSKVKSFPVAGRD